MSYHQPLVLINTVGTSLLANLSGIPDKASDLSVAFNASNWGEVARLLGAINAVERICGAEINSIESLRERSLVSSTPHRFHFCVSETHDGEKIGRLLEFYFESRGIPSSVHTIEGLRDDSPEVFRTHGLRNLVRKIGQLVRDAGGPDFVAINATGGYKAQIAIAVLIGQAMNVRVYYKHERFESIVAFPPMPVSFDWDILGEFGDLLDELDEKQCLELPEDKIPPAVRPLLEESSTADTWALAPIGQIFLEGFLVRFPRSETIPMPVGEDKRIPPKFRDDHYPSGFKEFVQKVWRETSYIISCHSLPYDRQRGIRNRRFLLRPLDAEIVGEYVDDNFGARFAIETSAATRPQKIAVIRDLNQRFGR